VKEGKGMIIRTGGKLFVFSYSRWRSGFYRDPRSFAMEKDPSKDGDRTASGRWIRKRKRKTAKAGSTHGRLRPSFSVRTHGLLIVKKGEDLQVGPEGEIREGFR